MTATFQQGQTLEQDILIQPRKCYTFVAGGVGPNEIEVTLFAKAPVPQVTQMPSLQMATAKSLGPKATLGAGGACFKLPTAFPVQARWVITATRGSGTIAGQAFSKMVP